MIVQVSTTVSTPRGALRICVGTLMMQYLQRTNTKGTVYVPAKDFLEHSKDVDRWIVPYLYWNNIYVENINILNEFKNVKGS